MLSSLVFSGCVLPFASPPVQVQAGIGVRRLDSERARESVDSFSGQVKVGVHPLQYLRGWTRRTVDFGGGYLVDFNGENTIRGAYAEVAPTLLRARRGPIRRLSLRGQARLLHATGYNGFGYGGSIQISGEWGGFVPGILDMQAGASGVTGYGWGESTMGGYLEVGYGQVDTLRVMTVTTGLQWRIPASLGLAYLGLGGRKE